jgi:integration host factor beta subunit
MIKAELIEKVVEVTGQKKKDATEVVELIIDSIKEALSRGGRVEIRGLGCFGVKVRKGRIGRNPQTGAEVQIPAKKVPYFRPGKELKAAVNRMSSEISSGS